MIDAWNPGTGENKIPVEELLPGEITAVTFQVGSYTVRSALRVYQIHDPDWYLSEPDAPQKEKMLRQLEKICHGTKQGERISGQEAASLLHGGTETAMQGLCRHGGRG